MMIISIGRNPENTIVLNDPSISGKHAELDILDNGQILLKDYSTNGTYANGQFVNQSSVYVSYGDSIFFPGNIPLDWAQVGSLLNQSKEAQQSQQPSAAPQPAAYQPQSSASQMPNCGALSAGSDAWPGNVVTVDFSKTMGEAFSIGFGNCLTCGCAYLLWFLTCWIPYLNMGTTYGLVAMQNAWAKGESFKATDIFASKYRRMLPELLLTSGLKCLPIFAGILMIIPAIVLGISTMFSTFIVLDRGYSPIEAVKESNRITYGSKWAIFGVRFILGIIIGIVTGIFSGIISLISLQGVAVMIICSIIYILVSAFVLVPIGYGITTSIWRQLSQNL